MNDQPLINPSIETNTESVKNIQISEQDKERYIKSVLSESPYTEEITIFDSRLTLKFRALTVQENTDVVAQIVLDRENGVAADNDAYFVTISSYRLCVSLMSVDDKPFSLISKEKFTPDDKTTYIAARAKEISNWPTLKLSAYLDAFQLFEAKIIKLSKEVHNANFWKASV